MYGGKAWRQQHKNAASTPQNTSCTSTPQNSTCEHFTKQPLYGPLPPIVKTIRRTRHCWRSRDELISDLSSGPPHMDEQRQEDQLGPTYNSSVPIHDVTLKTCRKQWTIEKEGEGQGNPCWWCDCYVSGRYSWYFGIVFFPRMWSCLFFSTAPVVFLFSTVLNQANPSRVPNLCQQRKKGSHSF